MYYLILRGDDGADRCFMFQIKVVCNNIRKSKEIKSIFANEHLGFDRHPSYLPYIQANSSQQINESQIGPQSDQGLHFLALYTYHRVIKWIFSSSDEEE